MWILGIIFFKKLGIYWVSVRGEIYVCLSRYRRGIRPKEAQGSKGFSYCKGIKNQLLTGRKNFSGVKCGCARHLLRSAPISWTKYSFVVYTVLYWFSFGLKIRAVMAQQNVCWLFAATGKSFNVVLMHSCKICRIIYYFMSLNQIWWPKWQCLVLLSKVWKDKSFNTPRSFMQV